MPQLRRNAELAASYSWIASADAGVPVLPPSDETVVVAHAWACFTATR